MHHFIKGDNGCVFYSQYWTKVSDQPPGDSPWCLLDVKLCGPQNLPERGWQEKYSISWGESKLGCLSHSFLIRRGTDIMAVRQIFIMKV
jgi:hypothetical protein